MYSKQRKVAAVLSPTHSLTETETPPHPPASVKTQDTGRRSAGRHFFPFTASSRRSFHKISAALDVKDFANNESPLFASMADEDPSSTLPINTYHCLCTTLILTTRHDLKHLPHREIPVQDGALILPSPVDITRSEEIATEDDEPAPSVLLNVVPDRKSIMIRREDGFEKRTLLRCGRCSLVVGYNLDPSDDSGTQSRQTCLLPGGLVSTVDMAKGATAEAPSWADNSG